MAKDSTERPKRSTASNEKREDMPTGQSRKKPVRPRAAKTGETAGSELTIGLDLGDRTSHYCVLDAAGVVIDEGSLSTTREGLRRLAAGRKAVIAMEVGTHSPWVSRLLTEYGHEVLVANARKLRMIYANRNKHDKVDARMLARVARMDRTLLSAIEHRPQQFAQDLAIVRSRDVLVRCRTQLISHVRGAVKSSGTRLKSCESECFARKAPEQLPDGIRQAMSPVLVTIELLTQQIRDLESKVDELGETTYPETKLLRQVTGVGPLIALVFVLTIQDPRRFARSRDVGPYVGLVPARSQSGRSDPQLRITKEGDMLLRRLLVQGAHYILGPFGPDCDLRRFGLALAERGGGNARKRAVVAVARKLAVLLHRLWQSGEVYEPLRREVAATATGANSGEPTKQGARAA